MAEGREERAALELERRRVQVRILETELAIREAALARARGPVAPPGGPGGLSISAMIGLVTALITGGLGLLGGAIVNGLQARSNLALEREKLQSSLILKAIETGSPEVATKNLSFLVQLG